MYLLSYMAYSDRMPVAIAYVVEIVLLTIVLPAACWMFNKLAGGTSTVPQPGLGRAFVTALVIVVTRWAAELPILAVVSLVAPELQFPNAAVNFLLLLAAFAVSVAVYSLVLPTSFGRGLRVALLCLVVCRTVVHIVLIPVSAYVGCILLVSVVSGAIIGILTGDKGVAAAIGGGIGAVATLIGTAILTDNVFGGALPLNENTVVLVLGCLLLAVFSGALFGALSGVLSGSGPS